MTERTRQSGFSSNLEDSFSYTDDDLKAALDDFLEDEKRKDVKPSILNFQTVVGFVIIFLTLSFLIQQIGLHIGPGLGGIMGVLPIIGGILVTIVGLGAFNKERRARNKREKERRRESRRHRHQDKHLFNNLDEKEFRRHRRKRRNFDSFSTSSQFNIKTDRYALRQNKKLFRSRKDKRIFGVCGGLAKYLGVSSTFVRLLFAVATLLGYGFPILFYFALAIVLPKEPYSLFDEDEFNEFT